MIIYLNKAFYDPKRCLVIRLLPSSSPCPFLLILFTTSLYNYVLFVNLIRYYIPAYN